MGKHLSKLLIPFILLGLFGMDVEIIARALGGELVGFKGLTPKSLAGWTSLWMILVYGFGFAIIGLLNMKEKYYRIPMIAQTLIGGIIIGLTELLSGILFNIIFDLHLWYYKDYFNVLHQICLKNFILFTISIPFAIWLYDMVSWALYRDDEEYHILKNYEQILRELRILR